MPDEDQNPGTTSPEVPVTQTPQEQPSQSATPADDSPQSVTENTENFEHPTQPIQTVGDAFELFRKNKQEALTGITKQGLPPGTVPPVKKPRDYSGLEPNEVSWFKNMGGQAFDALKPKYLAFKEQQKEIENLKKAAAESAKYSAYDHEQAFQLTPEFQTGVKEYNQISAELDHWQKQLAAIRAGQQWEPLERGPNGTTVIGAPREPNPQGESIILNAIMQGHSIRSGLEAKIEGIQNSFKSQHQAFLKQLKDVDAQIFAGADQNALNEAMKSKMPLFPAHLHGNPIVQSLAKALVVVDGLVAMINDKKANAATQTIKAKTAANAGPAVENLQPVMVTPGGKVGNVLDEFKKARMAGIA